jgi:arginine/ornithine transport system ATP-binding protein
MTSSEVAALHVQGLVKQFGGQTVLQGIDLLAQPGEVLAIMGASGCGKSTLLRCINLLENPQAGQISLMGETLKLVPDRQGLLQAADARQLQRWRTRVGMVFQQFHLWAHLTVMENLVEAPRVVLGWGMEQARSKARSLAQRVEVDHRLNHYPSQLSGGEQQRVAIARALMMEPAVLLFDEPTSALDPQRTAEVLKVMFELAQEGRTMLVVTHEMGFAAEAAHRLVFMHQGRIEEQGPPSQVMNNPQTTSLKAFLQHG